jgi:hypothetical protein
MALSIERLWRSAKVERVSLKNPKIELLITQNLSADIFF